MTKNYKAVLKSSLVMLVLFAVAGSGVAQAQVCQAKATPNMVRAEGITEMVGDISLRCRVGDSFFALEDEVTLTVELNTNITNRVTIADDDDRNVGIVRCGGR